MTDTGLKKTCVFLLILALSGWLTSRVHAGQFNLDDWIEQVKKYQGTLIKVGPREIGPDTVVNSGLNAGVVNAGAVIALPLRGDAPEKFPRADAIDYVDPVRDQVTVYDRMAIFYTPSRPFPKGFMWQVHSSTTQKTYGAIKDLEIDLEPYSYRPAKAGSPGRFAAVVALSKPGVYALRTCPVQITGGIFGTVSGQPIPIEDQCRVEGEFAVTKQELHYRGFILEPFPNRPLPEGAFVGKSEVALTKEIITRDVILSLDASWNRRHRSNNKIKKISQQTFAKGKFSFPETLDPGSRVMGTARFSVDQPPDVAWLDRHAKTPYNLEMQHALAVKFSIGDLTAISDAPPDRAMFSGPEAARPYGKKLAGGASPNRNMLEISRGWGRDKETEISFENDHEERLTPFGIPAQPLARHLADKDTLFVIPIKIELYEDTRITSDDFVKIQIWGYAVYGSIPGRYAGPLPTSHDEIPETVADQDAIPEMKPPGEQASKPSIETDRDREINPRQPDTAAYIRQWLTQAEPLENAKGAELRFDKWGRLYGKAANGGIITLNSKPDHTVSNIPEVHVWAHRENYDSLNLCKLEEFVIANVNGTGLSDCQKSRVSDGHIIPKLIGQPARAARKKLQDAGYRVTLRVGKAAPNPDQAFTVAKLQPPPGSTLDPGKTVFVTVYADSKKTTKVPDLIGIPAKEAKKRLQDDGYKVILKAGKAAPMPEQEYTVAKLQPAVDSELSPEETIVITVFTGVKKKAGRTIELPDLIGEKAMTAKTRLTGMDFKVKVQAAEPAETTEQAFTVKSMQPGPGSRLKKGKEVVLTVFVQPKKRVHVPILAKISNREAQKRLAKLGLKSIVKLQGPTSSANKAFQVIKTDPPAKTRVAAGSTVTIIAWGSFRRDKITLPKVWGMTVDEARLKLQDLGLRVKINRGEAAPDKASEGIIARQSPADGKKVIANSEVELWYHGPYIWQGALPDLKYLTVEQAREKLRQKKLKLKVAGIQTPAPSRSKVGTVDKQEPLAHSQVREGDLITVTTYDQTKKQQVATYSCSRFPGTEPFWDSESQSPRCKCKDDHVLRANKKGCDPKPKEKIAVHDTPEPAKQQEHCSLGKSGFIYDRNQDYFVFRSNRLNKHGSRKYRIAYGYQKDVAENIQQKGNMTLLMTAPLRELCPHLKENCSLTSMNHADRSFFSDICGQWSEPKASSNKKKARVKQTKKSSQSASQCQSYNRRLADLMQRNQQLSVKMMRGGGSQLGCESLKLSQKIVRLAQEARTKGCRVDGNIEQAASIMGQAAKQICGGQ